MIFFFNLLQKNTQKKKFKGEEKMIMTQEKINIDHIVDNMDYYHICGKLSDSLIKIGYQVNTTSVIVKPHPYDITKCKFKDALEVYKTNLEYITPVLDHLKIKYTVQILGKKTFPIIVFDDAKNDFRLLLKNLYLFPVLEIVKFE